MFILRIRLRLTSTNNIPAAFIITMMAGVYLVDDGSRLSSVLLTPPLASRMSPWPTIKSSPTSLP
jgi:hypothetical protein